jgi:hypothetical protein
MKAPRQQLPALGGQLLQQEILQAAQGHAVARVTVQVETTQPIGVSQQGQKLQILQLGADDDGEPAKPDTSDMRSRVNAQAALQLENLELSTGRERLRQAPHLSALVQE